MFAWLKKTPEAPAPESCSSEAAALVEEQFVAFRVSVLEALDYELPPSALAIGLVMIAARVRDFVLDHDLPLDRTDFLDRLDQVWLEEGLSGFVRLDRAERRKGIAFIRHMRSLIDPAIDDAVLERKTADETVAHVHAHLQQFASILEDERMGQKLRQELSKAWLAAQAAAQTRFSPERS